MMLIHKQNSELIQIIADQENIDIRLIQHLVPSSHKMIQSLSTFSSDDSVSGSASSSSSSSPDVE